MKAAYIKVLLLTLFLLTASTPQSAIKIARVKYDGGGDWYNDPSSEVNLLNFIRKNTNIIVEPKYTFVDLSTDDLFDYPLIYLTGHGNLNFSNSDSKRLRAYLENGGFLFIDDDYGLDKYVREEMKKVFPEQDFREIPFSHEIFKSHYDFSNGLPKIHEHDDKTPKAYGIFIEGRLSVFYVFESNLGDGWADPDVHKDPPEKREEALKMGTNIFVWALTN